MLTSQQQTVVDQAIEAINENRLYKIGGYAGTGKTTVAKYIAEKLPGCMAGAFTGKASYRLTQKGLPAGTIHSHIYEYGKKDGRNLVFHLKNEVDGDWFLIDEGSMIPVKVWNDLLSFGKPVLLLGDPGQLEPVGKDPRLMHKCNVILEQIHRQTEGNGIIEFASDVRLGRPVHSQYGETGEVNVIHNDVPRIKDLEWADIVICAFNRTRIRFNKTFRKIKGYEGLLCVGERIIVLRNNREFGVFNGQILTVKAIMKKFPDHRQTLCLTDDDIEVRLPLLNNQFGYKLIDDFDRSDRVLADYGYAITCHKSQGSEWDKVVVIDEQCPLWDKVRWRYTAITRASKSLRFFCKKKL